MLNTIKCVEDPLHPTFPEPVQQVCVRGDVPGKGFFLTATGWGTFKLGATIEMRSGQSVYRTRYLHFSIDAEGAYYLPAGFSAQEITVPVSAPNPRDGTFRFTLGIQKAGARVDIRVVRVEVGNDGSAGRTKWGFTLLANGDEVIGLPVSNYFSFGKRRVVNLDAAGTVPEVRGPMLVVIEGRH